MNCFYEKCKCKGIIVVDVVNVMCGWSYYGVMMVEMGVVDVMIGGLMNKYLSMICLVL